LVPAFRAAKSRLEGSELQLKKKTQKKQVPPRLKRALREGNTAISSGDAKREEGKEIKLRRKEAMLAYLSL